MLRRSTTRKDVQAILKAAEIYNEAGLHEKGERSGPLGSVALDVVRLPGSVGMAVAATVMNADRWTAGGTLMQSGSPGGWRSLVEAGNLVRENKAVLRDCAEAAAKAKKGQRCTITVSAPAQQ